MQYEQETATAAATPSSPSEEPITVASDYDLDTVPAHREGRLHGTIRHRNCLRVQSVATASFHQGMCAYCATIPKLDDLRKRVMRQAGHAAHSSHKNLRYALCQV